MNNLPDAEALTAYWREQIETWKESGLSGARFCQDHDLIYHRFVYWRQKFDASTPQRKKRSGDNGFAAVTVQPAHHCGLSLSLPNGLTVLGIDADNVSVVRQLLDQF